jgi:hypothetical protein
METKKRDVEVKDKELVKMLAGGVWISQSNNSKAEQLRIDDNTKGDTSCQTKKE